MYSLLPNLQLIQLHRTPARLLADLAAQLSLVANLREDSRKPADFDNCTGPLNGLIAENQQLACTNDFLHAWIREVWKTTLAQPGRSATVFCRESTIVRTLMLVS